jgi:hypothetical protein
MLFTPFFALLTALLGGFLASLPPWTIKIGDGLSVANPSDRNFIHVGLQVLGPLDRFIPIHDGLLPILGISVAITVGLNLYKGVMWLVNVTRGAGA